jgi:hypothetical protein
MVYKMKLWTKDMGLSAMKRKRCNHVVFYVPYKKTGPYSWNSLPPPKKKKDGPISAQFLQTLTLILLFVENLKNSKKKFQRTKFCEGK